MRTSIATLILVSTSASFLAGCATSAPHKHVTKNERAARADELFAAFDTNGDGFITKEELSGGLRIAGMPEMNPNLMLGLKKQTKSSSPKASRKLTEEEIQKTMKEAFERRDQDLDQRLDKEEFRKLVVERPPTEGDDPWAPLM